MCRNGINLTQFKLSIYQLKELSEFLEKSLSQWEDLTSSLGLKELSNALSQVSEEIERIKDGLENVIKKADLTEEGDSNITITPI